MKFFILYATLSLSQPIDLGLWQDVIPRIAIHRNINVALNPFDDTSPEEKALQKLGYIQVENNIQLNYVYNIQ